MGSTSSVVYHGCCILILVSIAYCRGFRIPSSGESRGYILHCQRRNNDSTRIPTALTSVRALTAVDADAACSEGDETGAQSTTLLQDKFLSRLLHPSATGHPRNLQPLWKWAHDQPDVNIHPKLSLINARGDDWTLEYSNQVSSLLDEASTNSDQVLLRIPPRLILTSEEWHLPSLNDFDDSTPVPTYYWPEAVLMILLLEQLAIGSESPWWIWIESLPLDLHLPMFEEMKNENAANEEQQPRASVTALPSLIPFLEQQAKQFHACRDILIPYILSTWPRQSKTRQWWETTPEHHQAIVMQWIFSVVITRSWRIPASSSSPQENLPQAHLVPLADLFNHHGSPQSVNVHPHYQPLEMIMSPQQQSIADSCCNHALEMRLTQLSTHFSISNNTPLYLSYGLSNYPARFVVNFGFVDTTADLITLHLPDLYHERQQSEPVISNKNDPLDLLMRNFLDPSQLVVCAHTGALAQHVWYHFWIRILVQNNSETTIQTTPRDTAFLQQVMDVHAANPIVREDPRIGALLDKILEDDHVECKIVESLQNYIQRNLLTDLYPDLSLPNHPSVDKHKHHGIGKYGEMGGNTIQYTTYMRGIYQRALEYLDSLCQSL